MNKNKEWLKEEAMNLYPSHSEMYEHPDYLTVEKVDFINNFIDLIDQLDEPEKIVIPQFVADYIEDCKENGTTLSCAYDVSVFSELANWLYEQCDQTNIETFAKAWFDGHKIKKEKLYYAINNGGETVLFRGIYGIKASVGGKFDDIPEDMKGLYKFTEAEIREFDPRYIAFAVEVTE